MYLMNSRIQAPLIWLTGVLHFCKGGLLLAAMFPRCGPSCFIFLARLMQFALSVVVGAVVVARGGVFRYTSSSLRIRSRVANVAQLVEQRTRNA